MVTVTTVQSQRKRNDLSMRDRLSVGEGYISSLKESASETDRGGGIIVLERKDVCRSLVREEAARRGCEEQRRCQLRHSTRLRFLLRWIISDITREQSRSFCDVSSFRRSHSTPKSIRVT